MKYRSVNIDHEDISCVPAAVSCLGDNSMYDVVLVTQVGPQRCTPLQPNHKNSKPTQEYGPKRQPSNILEVFRQALTRQPQLTTSFLIGVNFLLTLRSVENFTFRLLCRNSVKLHELLLNVLILPNMLTSMRISSQNFVKEVGDC